MTIKRMKAFGALSFDIARKDKHPISPSETASLSPLDISASTSPLPFQLTDGSCLWRILQQLGQPWKPAAEAFTPSSPPVPAISPIACGFAGPFDFCRLVGEIRDIWRFANTEESETFEQSVHEGWPLSASRTLGRNRLLVR